MEHPIPVKGWPNSPTLRVRKRRPPPLHWLEAKGLEASIADALKAIERATEPPASKRTHWACSVRQICAYLNRAPAAGDPKFGVYERRPTRRVGPSAQTN